MRTPWLALLGLLTLISALDPSSAATIHVPDGQPTIQAGIDAASPGDTVLVACGTYHEHDIEMKSGVCLTSETGQADCVTVDAHQQGRVFYCDGVDSLACIVGFTITGGLATGTYYTDCWGGGMFCAEDSSPTLRNCTFSGNWATAPASDARGGGVFCDDHSSPTLTDCSFLGNRSSDYGGGMYCATYSSPTLTSCTFSGNEARGSGGGLCLAYGGTPTLTDCAFSKNEVTSTDYGHGGGISCYSSSATFTDCTFSGNEAPSAGGMYCSRRSVVLTGCTFSGNRATYAHSGDGGGIYCCNSSSPTLTDCTFSGNEALTSGGGIFCDDSSPTFTDCTFSGNRATGSTARGGGIYCFSNSFPTLTGCTFSGNEATHQGGMLYCWDSTPVFTNCIIAFNQTGEFVVQCYDEDGTPEGSTPLLACCNLYGNANGDWVGCIADQDGADGNFSQEPLFCGMSNDDFTLCANSPCLPDSNDCYALVGAHGEGCPDCLSPVEMSSWGAIKAMYR